MKSTAWLLPALLLVTSAAAQEIPAHTSVGTIHDGRLAVGRELPMRGTGYHFETNRQNPEAHYGTSTLVGALRRAAATVASAHSGSDLAIHDIAFENGGRIRGHGSHRSGRDVDIAYYALEPDGSPMNPTRAIWFLSNLRSRDVPRARSPRLDLTRTWLFLRALFGDDEIRVQYVFMARGLQRRILRHAAGHPHRVAARETFRTPRGRNVDPHSDHYHVRIHCPLADVDHGCIDGRR